MTTAIIDAFEGVVITLTTTGNSQTLAAPTDTATERSFVVINNDTSTDPITVNGTSLPAGNFLEFYWDGSAWTDPTGGAGAGGSDTQIQYNNAGDFAGSTNHLWDETNKKETIYGDVEQVGGTNALKYTPTVIDTVALGQAPRFAKLVGNYLYVAEGVDNRVANL